MASRTGHTRHASCNAVTLVWGSLRFAPIIFLGSLLLLHVCTVAVTPYMFHKVVHMGILWQLQGLSAMSCRVQCKVSWQLATWNLLSPVEARGVLDFYKHAEYHPEEEAGDNMSSGTSSVYAISVSGVPQPVNGYHWWACWGCSILCDCGCKEWCRSRNHQCTCFITTWVSKFWMGSKKMDCCNWTLSYLSLMLPCVTGKRRINLSWQYFYLYFKVSTTLAIFSCCLNITRVCMLDFHWTPSWH